MSNVTALENEQRRALEAKSLINNKMLVEAFDDLERAYIELAQEADIKDDETRRNAVTASNVVKAVRQHLQTHMETGVLAKAELATLSRKRGRFSW